MTVSVQPRGVRDLIRSRTGRLVVNNIGYRIGALAALGAATVLVAWSAGAAGVGHYALLRVLPWLAGTVLTAGMDGAIVYYLANRTGESGRVRGSIVTFLLVATPVGAGLWVLAAPALTDVFFTGMPAGVVALAGLLIPSRMIVMTAKVAAQGQRDLTGSNRTHLLEGASFLPWYGAFVMLGFEQHSSIVIALILGDVTTALIVWRRLINRGFLRELGRPSWALVKQMCSFGIRMNIGEWVYLLNLRINVVLIGAIAGPAAVGVYAVAARFAEILQLPGMAMNYVLMPRFSANDRRDNARETRLLLPRTLGLAGVMALPLALGAGWVLPTVFGVEFTAAILPAQILLIGLVADAAGEVAMAYHYGVGRPGLFAVAAGAGLIVTVALDIVLIPRHGAVGAAWASTLSYIAAASLLLYFFGRHSRGGTHIQSKPRERTPDGRRLPPRLVDVVVAAFGLVLLALPFAVIAAAVRLTSSGPALFRQERIGLGGRPFQMLKFRSMAADAPARGGQLTIGGDPRITRVGAVLRTTKLDELPQLWNVVRGDMRLVGPRPEVPNYVRYYSAEQRQVLQVRPGITDPASMAFRDESDVLATAEDPDSFYVHTVMPRKLAINLEYLQHRSIGSDVRVLVSTITLAVLRRGRGRHQTNEAALR